MLHPMTSLLLDSYSACSSLKRHPRNHDFSMRVDGSATSVGSKYLMGDDRKKLAYYY